MPLTNSIAVRSASHAGPRLVPGSARAGTSATTAIALVKLLGLLCQVPLAYAMPLISPSLKTMEGDELPKSPDDPDLWVYLGTAMFLVVLGGAFAGLTIALMGQDEIYLQVIATSGEGAEKRHARRVLNLLKRGKHWVLVTLLLSNVITNETLPIVLDRSLGGGWPAVVTSTVLIVIFGEIAPQSVCVRYGLPIGAWMSPCVLTLMWIMSPVAWPTAKLLDWLLGEDHGTIYKKAGLKTLVTLHKTLGSTPGERLNEDEVTIISAVLDLKDKPVGAIMTPMTDVFTMSVDTVLDEEMMDTILSQGYSRIPIYAPENPENFIGMLLVKILITYDPEDCKRVRDFALATLPETAPDTSCLDIVNFFQEGKSHMVLVSESAGQDHGALGVVTLEDVIEELIGEEIIDESDVYVDVSKSIRRLAPAPKMRLSKHEMRMLTSDNEAEHGEEEVSETTSLLHNTSRSYDDHRDPSTSTSPRGIASMGRTTSGLSKEGGSSATRPPMAQHAKTSADIRQQFMHLGPSNAASRPRATKFAAVKIKPGTSSSAGADVVGSPRSTRLASITSNGLDAQSARRVLLDDRSGEIIAEATKASDSGSGTIVAPTDPNDPSIRIEPEPKIEAKLDAELDSLATSPKTAAEASAQAAQNATPRVQRRQSQQSSRSRPILPEEAIEDDGSSSSTSTIGPVSSRQNGHKAHNKHVHRHHAPHHNRDRSSHAGSTSSGVRTGGITENVIDLGGGMRKVVLEANGSSTSLAIASAENGAADDEDDMTTSTESLEVGRGLHQSMSMDRKESVDSNANHEANGSKGKGNGGGPGQQQQQQQQQGGDDKKKKKKRAGKKSNGKKKN